MITLNEAITNIFIEYDIDVPKNTKKITQEKLINFICSGVSARKGALGYSSGGWQKFIKKVFPFKENRQTYITYLLSLNNLQYCTKCNTVKNKEEFFKNKNRKTETDAYCIVCRKPINKESHKSANHRSLVRKYKTKKIERMPNWANYKKIKEIYNNCPKGYHVDHIIPLQGKLVSGLHIETNLQYLTKEDNLKKSNKWP